MNEDAPSCCESILNKLVGGGKMLEKIFVVDIIYFDDVMLKAFEQLLF